MQLEIGQIYEGRVRSITQYGAFVEVCGENEQDSATGMVHISEVANTFVKEIRDFLHDRGQQQCSGQADEALQQIRNYEPKRSVPQSEMSFEDKLLHFKQASEEKICDLKRGSERRSGSRSRRS